MFSFSMQVSSGSSHKSKTGMWGELEAQLSMCVCDCGRLWVFVCPSDELSTVPGCRWPSTLTHWDPSRTLNEAAIWNEWNVFFSPLKLCLCLLLNSKKIHHGLRQLQKGERSWQGDGEPWAAQPGTDSPLCQGPHHGKPHSQQVCESDSHQWHNVDTSVV